MFYGKPLHNYFLLTVGLLIIISSTGWTLIDSEQQQSGKKKESDLKGEKTMEEVYKNIKVLKGEPASQLGPTMNFFEASLGFNCGNCHVRNAFEKDDKPEKRKARDMIVMMNAINKENFKGEQLVTCFTCHKGTPDPAIIPDVITASLLKDKRKETNEDQVIKVPNRLNSAEEIISRYEQAIGGKEAFNKITSLKLEGKIESGNGRESSTTIYEKAPYYYFSETKSMQGNTQRGFNGDSGWVKTPWFERKMEGEDLQDLKLEADFYAPLNFGKNYSGLKLSDVDVIDQDTVYSVDGSSSKYRRFKFFFDTKSGLLIRKIQYDKTLSGDLQTQTDYKDYRTVNGVLFPFEMDVADYENIQQFRFSSMLPNITTDDSIFNKKGK